MTVNRYGGGRAYCAAFRCDGDFVDDGEIERIARCDVERAVLLNAERKDVAPVDDLGRKVDEHVVGERRFRQIDDGQPQFLRDRLERDLFGSGAKLVENGLLEPPFLFV